MNLLNYMCLYLRISVKKKYKEYKRNVKKLGVQSHGEVVVLATFAIRGVSSMKQEEFSWFQQQFRSDVDEESPSI